jgi:hypothetical protein
VAEVIRKSPPHLRHRNISTTCLCTRLFLLFLAYQSSVRVLGTIAKFFGSAARRRSP